MGLEFDRKRQKTDDRQLKEKQGLYVVKAQNNRLWICDSFLEFYP